LLYPSAASKPALVVTKLDVLSRRGERSRRPLQWWYRYGTKSERCREVSVRLAWVLNKARGAQVAGLDARRLPPYAV